MLNIYLTSREGSLIWGCSQIILNKVGKVGTYGDDETQGRCGYEWTPLIAVYVLMQTAPPLDHHPKWLPVVYTSEQEHLANWVGLCLSPAIPWPT